MCFTFSQRKHVECPAQTPSAALQDTGTYRKGSGRQLLGIRGAPLFTGELCRLALLKILPNAVLARMYSFQVQFLKVKQTRKPKQFTSKMSCLSEETVTYKSASMTFKEV